MELITTLLVGLVTIVVTAYVYFKISFNYFKSRGIPSDKPSIPYGNLQGVGKTVHLSSLVKSVYDQFKGTAKYCGLFFFAKPVIVLMDLDLVKNVLVKDFSYFVERGLYYNEEDDPLSAHLFSLDGKKWKQLRAKLTPTFTSGKMKFMFPTVVEVGDRFRDCLLEVTKNHSELEIKELLCRFTTDVIGTCAFGIECNSLKDPNAEFRNMGRAVFGEPRHSTLKQFLINGFQKASKRLHIKNIRDDVSEFFLKVVRDTVEYREKNKVSRNDFMDLLIKLKNEDVLDKELGTITFNEIAAQAFVFFLAGFETSSTTLTFCLFELALNVDIQEKTRNSIRETLKKHNGQLTYEAMLDMHYVEQVLQETLRKYPPVANLNRLAKMDYEVPDSNLVIEKRSSVLIPAYAIQHDPEYYPNPEKFDPDRFGHEETQNRNVMAWLPFGEGPRNCIGLRFGMMQTRIGLVSLLNNFEFTPSKKTPTIIKFKPASFILSPDGGLYLNVNPIN